jgi:hypothetical protein
MRATGLVLMLVAAACGLGACGKKPKPSAASSAAAAPAAPLLSARAMADKLLGGDFAPGDGYTVREALQCNPPTNNEPWTLRCRALLNDPGREGRPAIVDIELYDHDTSLASDDAMMKEHIGSFGNDGTITVNPSITKRMAKTGQTITLPTDCFQALGARNSPAYCMTLANPRVIITTGVAPAHSSSRGGITISADGKDSASEDSDHASDISVMVLAMINDD